MKRLCLLFPTGIVPNRTHGFCLSWLLVKGESRNTVEIRRRAGRKKKKCVLGAQKIPTFQECPFAESAKWPNQPPHVIMKPGTVAASSLPQYGWFTYIGLPLRKARVWVRPSGLGFEELEFAGPFFNNLLTIQEVLAENIEHVECCFVGLSKAVLLFPVFPALGRTLGCMKPLLFLSIPAVTPLIIHNSQRSWLRNVCT